MPELFAQVILPLSLHDSYTYRVPEEMHDKIKAGQRVIVQFGQKRLYSALVLELTKTVSDNLAVKEIIQVLDTDPIILPQNLKLWKWMASYYCAPLGDIFRAALPTGLKLESKTKIYALESDSEVVLSEGERVIINHLKNDSCYLYEIQKNLGNQFSFSSLNSLILKKLVLVEEKISEKYRPRTEAFLTLSQEIKSDDDLNGITEKLSRAKKQLGLLYHFCHVTKWGEQDMLVEISKKQLLEKTAYKSSTLNELIKKGILVQKQKQVSRIDTAKTKQAEINHLNQYQAKALLEIKDEFLRKNVTLIHGITASGKTEIYIHLIEETIRSGKQALYLVPEISLTTQIIHRLKRVFGQKTGIYHSRLNNHERVEVWEKVLEYQNNPDTGYQVILGARSSLFLPYSNLGLVIVDEEHDSSFKQQDPSPRYNARDMAAVLGIHHQAKVLLGSATPSYESYYNSLKGKYGLVNLHMRHAEVEPPELLIADLKNAYRRKRMHSVLSPELYELMARALEQNEQIILFQNRRGYSPYVECFSCGSIPKCHNCDVSLTYHKYNHRLVCHYCGYHRLLENTCDECGSPEVKTRGFGTEKIEDELKRLFKSARIMRMDLDTTRKKQFLEKMVKNLESKKTDILIGTQMVTKGLDFEHVSVVGILNADNLINFPDFRAYEKAFQLILQVSGRAGRKHGRGKVVIQTTQPEHPLFHALLQGDYQKTTKDHLIERQLFRYPPFSRLIKLIIKHKNYTTVDRVAAKIGDELRKYSFLTVLGPETPLIGKIKLWHHKEILVKINPNSNLDEIKALIVKTINKIKQQPLNRNCAVNIDVDPM